MATPDGVSSQDWDRVHELVVDIWNAEAGDDEDRSMCRSRLLDFLNELEVKYGPLPSILATRADFIDGLPEKISLLRRAYNLAEVRSDRRNVLYIAHSLAELYIQDQQDPIEGRKWLDCLRRCLVEVDNAWYAEEHDRLLNAAEQLEAGQG